MEQSVCPAEKKKKSITKDLKNKEEEMKKKKNYFENLLASHKWNH